MPESTRKKVSEELIELAESGHTAPQFSARYPKLDVEGGYRTMRRLHQHRLTIGWKPLWRKIGTSAGAVRAAMPPFNISEFEPRMEDVPALGAHSRKILSELGYGMGEIERLAEAGAISSS